MGNDLSSTPKDKHRELVERITTLRAALHEASDPEARNAILEELGKATLELSDIILKQEGPLRSPLE